MALGAGRVLQMLDYSINCGKILQSRGTYKEQGILIFFFSAKTVTILDLFAMHADEMIKFVSDVFSVLHLLRCVALRDSVALVYHEIQNCPALYVRVPWYS